MYEELEGIITEHCGREKQSDDTYILLCTSVEVPVVVSVVAGITELRSVVFFSYYEIRQSHTKKETPRVRVEYYTTYRVPSRSEAGR